MVRIPYVQESSTCHYWYSNSCVADVYVYTNVVINDIISTTSFRSAFSLIFGHDIDKEMGNPILDKTNHLHDDLVGLVRVHELYSCTLCQSD